MAKDKPKNISDGIPFFDIANLLEKLSKRTGPEKLKSLRKFLEKTRKYFKEVHGSLDSSKTKGDSLYSIIRILIPKDDRGRPAYNIKGHKLATILVEILALGKSSTDGQTLLHYKSPTKAVSNTGDLGTLLIPIMQKRFSSSNSFKGPTLTYIHLMLDELANNSNNLMIQKNILQKFFSEASPTPLEGKWLVRILIKNLCHSLKRNCIYDLIHPKAKELYKYTSNLKQVCQELNDPTINYDVRKVTMFSHCKPMLCTRMTVIEDGFQVDDTSDDEEVEDFVKEKKSTSKKKQVFLPTPPFVVESKWDGERFHIHYDGTILKYFSKNAYDYADNFNLTLTPRLKPLIRQGVKSFILDGEMMAWHKKFKSFTQKGSQIDVKKMNVNNPNHCPCFVAFDVLYFNGETLIDKPLSERVEILRQIIQPQEATLLITKQKLMHNKEQVLEALNEAIDSLEEGLIVKDIHSKYEPGERFISWIKIKPEYIDGTSLDDLDLLILGAYYTESTRKGGVISHFLVGAIKKSGAKEEFYPVARVGSGKLRNEEMTTLVNDLTPMFSNKASSNVHYKGYKNPDRYIDPWRSISLEVKASEITRNDTCVLGYTLRFPRITKVRKDKPYNEVMSVEEFQRIRESWGGKLVKRSDGKRRFPFIKRKPSTSSSDDDEPERKRQSLSPDLFDEDQEKPGSSTNISTRTLTALLSLPKPQINIFNVFNSKKFCVYGATQWKMTMEKNIKSHGGEIIQNPIQDRFWIVGENDKNYKTNNAIKTGNYNVVKPSWIQRCIEKKSEESFTPEDFFTYTEELGNQFKEKYDEFGDSYTEPITMEGAKALVQRIMLRISEHDSDNGSEVDNEEVNNELFPDCTKRKLEQKSFFKSFKIAFRGEIDPVLAADVEFYGGKIAKDETENGITHVIVQDPLSPSKKKHLGAMIVKPSWIEESVNKRKALDELYFTP